MTFRDLNSEISICNEDNNLFCINNEWTFQLPSGFEYAVDSEFDGGIKEGIDITGSIKPLVIKGLFDGKEYLFNFSLQKHYDPFEDYYSIAQCKYDNRFINSTNDIHTIVKDTDDLYVDFYFWRTVLGIVTGIRVRGNNIEPYDFSGRISSLDQDLVDAINEIAKSITLSASAKKTSSKKKSTVQKSKTVKTSLPTPSDPNCIIEGRTLVRYIGSDRDIVLPDGLTEIADNTFSGRDITSIVIPEGVTEIGRRAFENCYSLKTVSLPSTIKSIGGYAFVDCHKLRSINLGPKLTGIDGSVFSECYELENVVLHNKVKYIDAFAFKNCQSFTSMVIPSSVEMIGFTAFDNCVNLTYLYIPSSVKEILDNFWGNTPFDGCDNLTIHCPKGSYAEEYCSSHGLRYVIDEKPIKTSGSVTSTTSTSKSSSGKTGKSSSTATSSASEDVQKLSAEDYAELQKALSGLDELQNQITEAINPADKYGEYLERKEKEEKERKEKKKAAALSPVDMDKSKVDMYVILTNEKKIGKLRRNQKDFYDLYGDVFPSLKKAEIIQLRKDVIAQLNDAGLCSEYENNFRHRTVKERFDLATNYYDNVNTDEPDIGKRAKQSLENTREWYAPEEYKEADRLMGSALDEARKSIDEQLRPIEEKWTKFSTAAQYLHLVVSHINDLSELKSNCSCFQMPDNERTGLKFHEIVSVELVQDGWFAISTNVLNAFPWYWGVTVRDIWEAAALNEIKDERPFVIDKNLVEEVLEKVRNLYSETSIPLKPKKTSPASTVNSSYSINNTKTLQSNNTVTAPSYSNTSTPKNSKEGCYIATAVYGSYDSPQVLTLRKFRDEVLKETALGRWFIRIYYRLSPPIAEKLRNANHFNCIVRSVLDLFVNQLNNHK